MITLIAVGKIKNKAYSSAYEDYVGRVHRYCKFRILELKDRDEEKEGKDILTKSQNSFLVALSPFGAEFTSEEFADFIKNNLDRKMTFVIGSENGLSKEVYDQSNMTLSISKMTLPHELARVVFLEQLYRAFTIIKKEKYHK